CQAPRFPELTCQRESGVKARRDTRLHELFLTENEMTLLTQISHLHASTPEARLTELGIVLPAPSKPVAAYVPFKRVENLLYVAGQIPMKEGQLLAKGRVGVEVPPEIGLA